MLFVEAEGRTDMAQPAYFCLLMWGHGDIVNCVLARQLNVRDRQHCIFLLSWAVGTEVDAFCHIDVLVCGPSSVSGKAEGENLC